MKSKQDFLYTLDQVRVVIVRLRPEDMDLPTPDTEWNVHDLLHHMLYELLWLPDMVAGCAIDQVGNRHEGDILGSNPIAAWRAAAVEASEAIRRCDPREIAHLSYGDRTVRQYLQELGANQLIHAWDLGQAVGVKVALDETIVSEIYQRALLRTADIAASGCFAEPVMAAKTADTQTKLLALLGRSENWK